MITRPAWRQYVTERARILDHARTIAQPRVQPELGKRKRRSDDAGSQDIFQFRGSALVSNKIHVNSGQDRKAADLRELS
jgi:hypothetical protein